MATCKECFHFEVCDNGRHIGEYIEDDGLYTDGVERGCPAYKAIADVVEVKHGVKIIYNTVAVLFCILTLGFVDVEIKYSDGTRFKWVGWVTRLM